MEAASHVAEGVAVESHRGWCRGDPVTLKLEILERRSSLDNAQAWNMKEAAENKGELQKNAEEQSEGKGSQNQM